MSSLSHLRRLISSCWPACVLGLGAGVTVATAAPALSIEWAQSTKTPDPTDGYAGGVIDGRLITVGGTSWDGSPGKWTQKIYETHTHAFDPKTQTWETLPDIPVRLGYPASTTMGGEMFVIGGYQDGKSSSAVHILKKTGAQFAWHRGPDLPEQRVFASAVPIGSKLYVVGGTKEYEPYDAKGTCCTSLTARNTLWVLDRAAPHPKWKALAGYPGDLRWQHMAATDGVALYLFGGIFKDAEHTPTKNFYEVLRYDPATDHWSKVADLPPNLQGAAAVSVHGKIVLVSGRLAVSQFDPITANFTALQPLSQKATMPNVSWIDPYIVGTSGESEVEGPRRRSDLTFIGKVTVADATTPAAKP